MSSSFGLSSMPKSVPGQRRGRARLDPLSPGERNLYDWILRSFASGIPPAPDTLADAVSNFDVEVEAALAVFAREDLVHHDANGAILVAYPFSGVPRGHHVRIDGTIEVEAMCAIDALGIAPMLNREIEIVSRDPHTGSEVWARLTPGEGAWWQPQTAVVLDGCVAARGPSFRSCCTALNFFESSESALEYLAANPEVSGRPVPMPDAIELGRAIFADLMKES